MEASESSATRPVSTEKSRANNRIYPEFPDLNLVDSLSLSILLLRIPNDRSPVPPFKKKKKYAREQIFPLPLPSESVRRETERPGNRVNPRRNFISRRLFDVSSLFRETRRTGRGIVGPTLARNINEGRVAKERRGIGEERGGKSGGR